jgi:hypothetical protein
MPAGLHISKSYSFRFEAGRQVLNGNRILAAGWVFPPDRVLYIFRQPSNIGG